MQLNEKNVLNEKKNQVELSIVFKDKFVLY